MTIQEIAKLINGIEYPCNLGEGIIEEAKASGIVIVFGASDDLTELRGAIDDEVGCYNGKTFHVIKDDVLIEPDCDCEYAEKWYELQKEKGRSIEAVWSQPEIGSFGVPWSYKTDIPHEKFNVMEDGEVYCTGIVFNI